MSFFPPITFHFGYTPHDVKLYTFLIHSAIREFQHQLKQIGFEAFNTHPIRSIDVSPNPMTECNCLGLAILPTDELKLRLPSKPGPLEVSTAARVITHEIGHHLVQEYYGDNGEANRIGNNLIHWQSNRNDDLYEYTKTFNSVVFVRKYLIPFARVSFPNLPRLISEKDMIQESIRNGTAPRGIHEYW